MTEVKPAPARIVVSGSASPVLAFEVRPAPAKISVAGSAIVQLEVEP